MISIITASYNYAQYIKETIASVLAQTYQDWEMIIVDDCSSDNSVEVIKSFNDDRIKLFLNERNLGLAKTVERGLKECSGDWIVFLESDDLIKPDYLEKKLQVAKKYPEVNLIFNSCEVFGDQDRIKNYEKWSEKPLKWLKNQKFPKNMFLDFYDGNKIFTFSAVMAKKSDLLKIDFNPKYDHLLDFHLWIQMSHLGCFYFIDENLTKWRMHKSSYISNTKSVTPFNFQVLVYKKVCLECSDIKNLINIYTLKPIVYYFDKIKQALRKRFILHQWK